MTITFVQRCIIIFTIVVCYYQSWVSAVDCEKHPYDISCRGSQLRKRLLPLPIMRTINCDETDCSKLPRMKFLIAILDDNPRDVYQAAPLPLHSKKKLAQVDQQDVYMDY
ncbi:uncharacterized protein LOC126850943 [Cataglyphis hispanica]|uniref:uncharacterized protein LOC126850943 n=1 Tax=Cataglyphis hispanica TaxID=1086592 RepID=UPI00218016BC|nr:uncharacterized protein LOC126850943 [Cataglyphis hispanica]XP_050450392.1 uncharacterized protein LOC126850943 [Cataglyphis hispanica]